MSLSELRVIIRTKNRFGLSPHTATEVTRMAEKSIILKEWLLSFTFSNAILSAPKLLLNF